MVYWLRANLVSEQISNMLESKIEEMKRAEEIRYIIEIKEEYKETNPILKGIRTEK